RDDVDRLLLHLAFSHQRFQSCGRAQSGRSAAPQLGVHPGDDPGGAVVGRVRDVHAAGASEHDRPWACRLGHHLHYQGGLAPLAGPVTRSEELLERNAFLALDGIQLRESYIDSCHCSDLLAARGGTSKKSVIRELRSTALAAVFSPPPLRTRFLTSSPHPAAKLHALQGRR